MYAYAATEQASKAKLDDFLVTRHDVKSEDILPPYQPVIQVEVEFYLNKFRMYDERNVLGLLDCYDQLVRIASEQGLPPPDLVDDGTKHRDALKLFHDGEGQHQQEIAINATFIKVLQKSIFSDFEVKPFSTGMLSHNICKYTASHQDIIIYHQERYIQKGRVNAALVASGTSGEEEIEAECTVVKSAFESKLLAGENFGQLAANMSKLAADLCVKAGNILIKEIKICGALIDIQSNKAKPASLQICFNNESTLTIGRDWMPITDCMYRICNVLSS